MKINRLPNTLFFLLLHLLLKVCSPKWYEQNKKTICVGKAKHAQRIFSLLLVVNHQHLITHTLAGSNKSFLTRRYLLR